MRKLEVVDAVAAILFFLWSGLCSSSNAFLMSTTTTTCCRRSQRIIPFVSLEENNAEVAGGSDEILSDDELLQQVPLSQLVQLCEQYQLPTGGTSLQLLERLRDFAEEQARLERQRLQDRVTRVQEGARENSKEKYEIVSDDADDYDEDESVDDGFFYFALPTLANATEPGSKKKSKTKPAFISNTALTAPPPPDIEPDENGERIVTVYSSTDLNDLTGITNAQPGQSALNSQGMMATSANEGAPWDLKTSQQRSESTSKELEEANELLTEVVQSFLSLSGAPGFREEFTDGLRPIKDSKNRPRSSFSPEGFVGFDPKKVSTETLIAASPALRIGRGQVLQEVLREFELRAIGYDGMAGDDVEKGGGHYKEVSKVRAFLEGYRRAEVRRVARETLTMLLDKLVSEGVEGLDLTLASMTRSSDDNGDVGELNDSLLDFLNDAIRQQKKKVQSMMAKETSPDQRLKEADDALENYWNVTTEDGVRVETLDPNNPEVRRLLESERLKSEETNQAVGGISIPDAAPEKLLLLLNLLRDRLKTEAAFTHDEKGRNLRVLAYCLRVATPAERRALIKRELGTSIDRLDSFSELVASSIEYVESTSYQLQPSKSTLNLNTVRSVLELVADMKQQETRKASGAKTNNSL